MSDVHDVLTIDDARRGLNLAPHDAGVDDLELARLVTAASRMLDERCGPIIARDLIADVDGGGRYVRVVAPVLSVTSVTEWPDGVTVVEEDRDAPTGTDWRLGPWGLLERRAWGRRSVWASEVHVVYRAGRAEDLTEVDARFVTAAQIIVAHLWRAERGAATQTWGGAESWPGGVTATGVPTFGMPRAALDIVAGEIRPVGVG